MPDENQKGNLNYGLIIQVASIIIAIAIAFRTVELKLDATQNQIHDLQQAVQKSQDITNAIWIRVYELEKEQAVEKSRKWKP